jgi:general secretion pathway protein G
MLACSPASRFPAYSAPEGVFVMQIQSRAARAARAGFSLAELMVVIVIIGLLATLVVPNVIRNLFVANTAKAKADIVQIDSACGEYAIQNQMKYPESLQELVTPDETGYTYLKRETVPLDPWGNEYMYEPPGGGTVYPTITSYGSDGVPGGEADAKDITSHAIRNGEI